MISSEIITFFAKKKKFSFDGYNNYNNNNILVGTCGCFSVCTPKVIVANVISCYFVNCFRAHFVSLRFVSLSRILLNPQSLYVRVRSCCRLWVHFLFYHLTNNYGHRDFTDKTTGCEGYEKDNDLWQLYIGMEFSDAIKKKKVEKWVMQRK